MSKKHQPETAPASVMPLIAEAERIIREAVKHFELDVDPDKVVVTVQTKGRGSMLGWFWADKWQNAQGRLHEINLSAEYLREHDMGEVIIHELAHAENNHHGIKDCTKSQYHNLRFKSQAEDLGLVVSRHPSRGYAITELGPRAEEFLKGAKFDRSLFELLRPAPEPKEKKPCRMRLWECACPVKVRIASDDARIVCRVCMTRFKKKG